jgi:hypothetical protein
MYYEGLWRHNAPQEITTTLQIIPSVICVLPKATGAPIQSTRRPERTLKLVNEEINTNIRLPSAKDHFHAPPAVDIG